MTYVRVVDHRTQSCGIAIELKENNDLKKQVTVLRSNKQRNEQEISDMKTTIAEQKQTIANNNSSNTEQKEEKKSFHHCCPICTHKNLIKVSTI